MYNTSVNMHPPSSVMLHSIRDIVSQENLTNVGIIYDSSFGEFTSTLGEVGERRGGGLG